MIEPSRRDFLRQAAVIAGGAAAVVRHSRPVTLAPEAVMPAGAAQTEAVAAMRAQMGSVPISATKLTDRLVMLSGPGGNVVVLHGTEGKLIVDSLMQPAWTQLKSTLDGLGGGAIRTLIDTHWHLDHVDN